MKLLPATVLLLLMTVPATAQLPEYSGEKNWTQVCKQATTQPVDDPHLTGPLPPDELAHCDESALYYGFDGKPDYPAALQCAWYQRAHPQSTVGNMFYGPGVLTMLYANGIAVPRNLSLAMRFACEQEWAAPAEMELRIGHLEYLARPQVSNAKFDLCDDITSGLSMGTCTGIVTSRADVDRAAKVKAIMAGLPSGAMQYFPRLQSAESAFEDARTRNEVDLSGTARGMFALEEEKRLRDQFLINLQRFLQSEVPRTTPQGAAALDRQLNAVYQQIMNSPPETWEYGTIKPEGIRETERAWLALTAAWLDYARAAYPHLSAVSIRAQLIRLRLHQLRSLAPNGN